MGNFVDLPGNMHNDLEVREQTTLDGTEDERVNSFGLILKKKEESMEKCEHGGVKLDGHPQRCVIEIGHR